MIAQISDELYPQLNVCGKIIENHVDEDISVYGDLSLIHISASNRGIDLKLHKKKR